MKADLAWGKVECVCGYAAWLGFPQGTPSPAPFKTWCAVCGLVMEGAVELGDAEPPKSDVTYVPTSHITSRGSA